MANAFGFDLGKVYQNVENLKDARQNREHRNTLMNWQTEDREAARQRSRTLAAKREAAVNGGEKEMLDLLQFDPEAHKLVSEALNTRDDRKRAEIQRSTEYMAKLAYEIRESKDPQAALDKTRAQLPPEMAEKMPAEFDYNDFTMVIARAANLDQILKNPEKITFGDKDQLWKNGQKVGETNAMLKGGSGGGGKSVNPLSVSSDLRQAAAEYLGGNWDPVTKRVGGLDKDQLNVWAQIIERAEAQAQAEPHRINEILVNTFRESGVERKGKDFSINRLQPQTPNYLTLLNSLEQTPAK